MAHIDGILNKPVMDKRKLTRVECDRLRAKGIACNEKNWIVIRLNDALTGQICIIENGVEKDTGITVTMAIV